MRLLFATKEFTLNGRGLSGFPLLVTDAGEIEPAFHGFMVKLLLEDLGVQSRLTWEAYGRRLCDYFMFLHENGLNWNDQPPSIVQSPLRRYRAWSIEELKLNPRTVNSRLLLIARFYNWAISTGHIQNVPFKLSDTRVNRPPTFLEHARSTPARGQKYDFTLREVAEPIRILSPDQIYECRETIRSGSHRMLFELMLRSGLRSVEARTFPVKYVLQRPSKRAVCTVRCSPKDMHLKFNKPRTIHVPGTLMEELSAYRDLERNVLIGESGRDHDELVLSANGGPYARTTIVSMFAALERKLGFEITAHMLRHSYATYTLRALKRSDQFNGDPLLYVRDRMGHSDVSTTIKYLHLLDQLEGELALAHEDYIDRLFELPEGPDA